jgi:uncharacterized protein (DUF488 family)
VARDVFTIGHSTRTWEDFRNLLRAHGIERLVDVRTMPRSRRHPQFNKEELAAKLRGTRIGYVHLPKLGGLRRAARESRNTGWRNASFRGYADYMQTTDFAEGLQRLMRLAEEKRTAIMCAEAVPWRCHRSMVADALAIRGIHVQHILSEKRAQVHAVTPFAHVEGDEISYPGAADGAVPRGGGKSSKKQAPKRGKRV